MVVVVRPDAVCRRVQDFAAEVAKAELKNEIELERPDGAGVALVETLEFKFVPDDRTLESISGRHLCGTVDTPERAGTAQEIVAVRSPQERAATGAGWECGALPK
jgi:hypothetical protein